jgi:hypothetical protein
MTQVERDNVRVEKVLTKRKADTSLEHVSPKTLAFKHEYKPNAQNNVTELTSWEIMMRNGGVFL